ncbi:MAG: hypothetical protein NTV49_05380 [Kiritimatiellaeota bacterium]|nr:hypothetical protein [Kiritimatiellota bacterium]
MRRLNRGILLAALLGVGAMGMGCASPMVERRTAREYEARGFERSDRNPDMLIQAMPPQGALDKAGLGAAKPVKLSIKNAAWSSHPILYFASLAWDYVVLPVGGTALAVVSAQQLMGSQGDESHTTTITTGNNSPVIVHSGDGAPRISNPNNPTTISTTTGGE